MEEKIENALEDVIDPETGVSIVDMGFIYSIEEQDGEVDIEMTLTTPGCPMHSSFKRQVREKTEELEGIDKANVDIVFDPSWTPEMMSKNAKEKLGFGSEDEDSNS